jgi:hypothetical protein
MKVKIQSIADRGNPDKERIVMRVRVGTDIGRFAVLDAGYSGGSVNTDITDAFWFPDKTVREGDLVVLYTKSGRDNEKSLKSGNTSHFFYWGRTGVKWQRADRVPVLLQVDEWHSYEPKDT